MGASVVLVRVVEKETGEGVGDGVGDGVGEVVNEDVGACVVGLAEDSFVGS